MRFLVIGYGSLLRGDDAVGQEVAQGIANWKLPYVVIVSLHQLTPELADDLAKAETAYFLDACIDANLSHPRVTEIQEFFSPESISHFSTPQTLLTLTQQLYDYKPRAYQIEIPAESFELGEGLSTKARMGLKETLEYLRYVLIPA